MGTLTPHPILSSFHTHLLPCPPPPRPLSPSLSSSLKPCLTREEASEDALVTLSLG